MVDLRSDTLTMPDYPMLETILTARLGDDGRTDAKGRGEDPTINRLEDMAAALVGKEAAILMPTGTFGNTIAVMTHCHAGQTVLVDGKIAGISPIMFLNIRIAHEKCGCARKILPLIRQRDSIYNTLILSMPGAGKTTLLRDSIRALSNGEAYGIRLKVCVVDERSEIAASFHGVPQNDMGPRTDVMDGCGKAEGMQLLIRSMSPQIIAVDELGAESDFYAVEQALNCGSRVLGTIHAGNMKELSEKPYLKRWMERRLFQRFIFLEKEADGRRKMQVYDEHMERITC